MSSRSARNSPLALTALAAVVALAGCGGGGPRFPSSPTRLVTDDVLSTDVMLSLGYRPVGAVGLTALTWPPALAPYLGQAQNLGARAGGSHNVNAIGIAQPDAILAPLSLKRLWGSQLSAIAPTFYYVPGRAGSSWQKAVRTVAASIGPTAEARASRVIADLALRAAAIREQVRGKTIALLRLLASQSFSTVDDYDPAMTVAEQDLGLRNLQLRPPMYGNRCAARPSPPRVCATDELSLGVLMVVPSVAAVLLETGSMSRRALASFDSSPYVRRLAAVREGHVASAPSYEDVGPLGVAYLYSAIEQTFGLLELHGTVAGRTVELTYAPASRRLCWAGGPPHGAVLFSAGGARESLPSAMGCLRTGAGTSLASARLGGSVLLPGAPSPMHL